MIATNQQSSQGVNDYVPPTEDEMLEMVVPLVLRLRLLLSVQIHGCCHMSSLYEITLAESGLRWADDVVMMLHEWLPHCDAKIKWGRKFMDLIQLESEKSIISYLKNIEDKKMRTLMRMGWACHQLSFVENLVQDGEAITKLISSRAHMKLDDALSGFLVSWANDDNEWGPRSESEKDSIASGVPTS